MWKTYKKIFFLALVLLIMLVFSGCLKKSAPRLNVNQSDQDQQIIKEKISGLVMSSTKPGTPDTCEDGDQSCLAKQTAGQSQPVSDAKVVLKKFYHEASPAGEIIVETTTDEEGHYELLVEPGIYFLVVSRADIAYPVFTTGNNNFDDDDLINDYKSIEVKKDGLTFVNFELPQAWPE